MVINMGIESFAEDVKENVERKIGKGYDVSVRKVDKNNGVTLTGLCVKQDGTNISPVIYMDSHYEGYKKGSTTPADTADYVAYICRKKRHAADMRRFLNYGDIKNSIVYSLVNTDKNRELLKDLPHLEYLDLSIIFQCLVEDSEIGTATMLIHNAHAKLWGVSERELYGAASENTPKLCGYELKSIGQILQEIMLEKELPERTDSGISLPLYVLTNRRRTDGAACILYPNFLKDFSEALGRGFYIIPSSVHETLILPAGDMENCGELREMIKEVNDTQLLPEEILSYSLYYYDRENDEVRML